MNEQKVRQIVSKILREMAESNLKEDSLVPTEIAEETIDEMEVPSEGGWAKSKQLKKAEIKNGHVQ